MLAGMLAFECLERMRASSSVRLEHAAGGTSE